MKKFITLDKEDIRSKIHPYLWESFLETLGLDEDTESIDLCLSEYDLNKKDHTLDGWKKIKLKDVAKYGTEYGYDEMRIDIKGQFLEVIDYNSKLISVDTINETFDTTPETYVYVK